MGEIIIDGKPEKAKDEKDEMFKLIAVNAMKTMSEMLVEMENSAMNSKEMMQLCVWPILEEAHKRSEKVSSNGLGV